MLGTFKNGRFEQFLPSQTLTAADLRNPQTSMQIGKRMKELHIGIELLDEEREAGPSVWKNWSKWTERAEEVVSWADRQVRDYGNSHLTPGEDTWKSRGYVCGTEWPAFRHAVERYHSWLDERVGGGGRVADGLVFAHSDASIYLMGGCHILADGAAW